MEHKKVQTPPYATVNKMIEMFDLLSSRSFSRIDPSDLQARGFSKADAFQVLASLKFLGLLKEDNTKTDNLPRIQLRGDQRDSALKEIVKNSYSLLFSTAPEANKLSRDDLHNEFMAVYKVSPRIAKTATPLFIWLCKQAGFDVSENIPVRTTTIHTNSQQKERKPKNLPKTQADFLTPPKQDVDYQIYDIGEIKLLIPKKERYMNSIMDSGLKEVKTALENFNNRVKNIESTIEETPAGLGNQARTDDGSKIL